MARVLIVDDEDIIRDAARLSLKDEGYDIYEASNGKEALEMARKVKPDIVILDLMMPDKWGYAVCEELKSDTNAGNPVILILTARGSAPSIKLGERKGGDEYMTKPFEPALLRKRVKELLESRE